MRRESSMTVCVTRPAAPKEEEFEVLKHGLNAFNESFTGYLQRESIASFVKDESGTVLGGILGEIKWGWLYVQGLWIDAALRGAGWGSALLTTLEDYALTKDVSNFRLETTSFQALDFYRKMGYRPFGELRDFPPGHVSYFLKKQVHLR